MTDFESSIESSFPYPPEEITVDDDIRLRRMSVSDAPLLAHLREAPVDAMEEGLRLTEGNMQQRLSASYIADYQGTSVAWINLHDREGDTASLGYGVTESAQGKGIASRSAQALCDWGFTDWGLEKINIYVNPPDNLSSIRVAERLGAVEFGEIEMPDDPSELARKFVLTKKDDDLL
jgi:ribosomal-protein-alanine N-acetyltransferase